MENIPINNSNNSGNNGDVDLQLIKQIITYEYKTVSTAKDKLEKVKIKIKKKIKKIIWIILMMKKMKKKLKGKKKIILI